VIEVQPVKNIMVKESHILETFSHLILSSDLLAQLGPAVNSGCAVFLYGPSGNGKTSIAETIARRICLIAGSCRLTGTPISSRYRTA
jgi:ABC-type transport system involved in cytochrome bd biosynthesis fused ATPase/permease subunit